MQFPENATKSDKRFIKKMYIESLTTTLISHEQQVKDMEQTIKNHRKAINETKKHIKKYQSLIKDAEDTVI
jgi:peptidoglycan hydrolase CwlO-like protein